MKTKTINQTVTLPGKPAAVYSALMNSKRHTAFTTMPAKIDARVGGKLRCYDDYIIGINLDLIPKKRIVQAWRSKDWPKEHYSIVTFVLSPARGGKTRLRFTHLGVPAGDYKSKNAGWRTHYWERLKRFLAR